MRILFFLFFTFTCLAQNNDQRLAYQYFVDGDYEKAIVLYEEINKKKFSINTYNPYYTSLINLNRFSEAEKIARKQFAKNNSRLNFLADVIGSGCCILYLRFTDKNNSFADNKFEEILESN